MGIGSVRANMKNTTCKDFCGRQKGVTTVTQTDYFTFDTIFLITEGERAKGGSEEFGIGCNSQVEALLPTKELHVS